MSNDPAKKPDFLQNALNGENLVVQPKSDDPSVTEQVYADIAFGWDFLNGWNFDGKLSQPVFVFTRHKKIDAYFRPNRFQNLGGDLAHEIGLNSTYVRSIGDAAALALIARLQCHQWFFEIGSEDRGGKIPAPGYTNRSIAAKMIEVGLMPTRTGLPEGKQTGFGVSHLVIEGGQFDLDRKELIAGGFRINWHSKPEPPALDDDAQDADADTAAAPPKKKATRTKFTCRECDQSAMASPSAELLCGKCGGVPMVSHS